MSLGSFVVRRLLRAIPMLLAASLLTFVLLNLLPGDPARAVLGDRASPEALAELRRDLGLDRPLLARYAGWLGDAIRGDLGISLVGGRPVTGTILQRLGPTLEILVLAQVLALGLAVPIGLFTAARPTSPLSRALGTVTLAGVSFPTFLIATLLVLWLAVGLRVVPAAGYTPWSESPLGNLRSVLAPALAIALGQAAAFARLLRAEMLEAALRPHVRTARAKGASDRRILVRHVFPGSLLPLATLVGLGVGELIGGAAVVESLFAIPGVGGLLVDAVTNRDVQVVQGVVILSAVAYVAVDLVLEVVYAVIDPRIRHGVARA